MDFGANGIYYSSIGSSPAWASVGAINLRKSGPNKFPSNRQRLHPNKKHIRQTGNDAHSAHHQAPTTVENKGV
jgi:hypothetical protein